MSRTNFCRLPVGAYFRYCRGRTGYKKVAGPRVAFSRKAGRRVRFAGGASEMALGKRRRVFLPVRQCSCVVKLTRAQALRAARTYQKSKRRGRR